jgi:hypothetical protein
MPARTQASPIGRTPAERCGDKQIDRGVLQKIHAVCEQRDGTDGASNRELDAEIGQVQKSNDDDDLAQSHVHFPTLAHSLKQGRRDAATIIAQRRTTPVCSTHEYLA